MSSFSDLRQICPALASPGCDALRELIENPLMALENLALQASYLTQAVLAFEGIDEPADGAQIARLNILCNRGLLPTVLLPFFHTLAGENHKKNDPTAAIQMKANLHAKLTARLTAWFTKSYGPYLPPSAFAAQNVEAVFQTLRTDTPSDAVPQDPTDEPAAILLERIRQEKAREATQPIAKDRRKGKKMKKSFQCHKDGGNE